MIQYTVFELIRTVPCEAHGQRWNWIKRGLRTGLVFLGQVTVSIYYITVYIFCSLLHLVKYSRKNL
jgi:hypothetical protein